MRLVLLLLLCSPAVASAQFLQFIRVGAGAGCDVATVHEALALARSTAGPAEIRVAYNRSHEAQALVVDDVDYVVIKGGYASCQNGTPDSITVLDGFGNGGEPVLHIASTSDAEVRLERLRLSGANVGAGSGGGVRMQGRRLLTLHDVQIRSNLAASGGGLHVDRTRIEQLGQRVILSGTTSIFSNRAVDGGAISSEGGLIDIGGAVRLFDNRADRHGGAIHLDRASRLVVESGRIEDNAADVDGGGIHATGGSAVALATSGNASIRLDNLAGRNGGAIHARADQGGQTTRIDIAGNVQLLAEAGGSGAVIYLDEAGPVGNPARVQLSWNEPAPLARVQSSMLGFANGSSGALGALVHVSATNGTAQAVIRHVDLRYNRAAQLFRIVGRNAQGGAQLFVSDSEISVNNAESLLRSENGDFADFSRITLAVNAWRSALFVGAQRYLRLQASVIHDPGAPFFDALGATQLFANHLLVHDSAAFPAALDILEATPRFVRIDPTAPDLRLRSDSPALDFAPAPGSAVAVDRDGNPRTVDLPERPDAFGPLDLGAYERFDAVVFTDGFEAP